MKKIFLNAGHGGVDSGAVGINGLLEKDVNIKTVLYLRDFLVNNGVQVFVASEDLNDESQSSSDVLAYANLYDFDYVIDIHYNSFFNDGAHGFECFIGKSNLALDLAKNIEKEIINIGLCSRGIKKKINNYGYDYYYFIRETNCPAIILEGCFVTSKEDYQKFLCSDEKIKSIAIAYGKGILKTLGIVENNSEFKRYLCRVKRNITIYDKNKNEVGICPKGTYTIVGEEDNLCKLKSGVGYLLKNEIEFYKYL